MNYAEFFLWEEVSISLKSNEFSKSSLYSYIIGSEIGGKLFIIGSLGPKSSEEFVLASEILCLNLIISKISLASVFDWIPASISLTISIFFSCVRFSHWL